MDIQDYIYIAGYDSDVDCSSFPISTFLSDNDDEYIFSFCTLSLLSCVFIETNR